MPLLTSRTGNDPLQHAVYGLAEHVCICAVNNSHVLLDLKRNRYYQIALANQQLRSLARREPIELPAAEQSQSWIQPLIHAGLLEPGISDTGGSATTMLDEACIPSDIPQTYSCLPNRRDVAIFTRSLIWARWMLRRHSFYEIAQALRIRRQMQAACKFNDTSILMLIARFRQIRPWAFASKNQCLLHALTLVRFSMFHGLQATWVVGVMTQPWAAHSWAQHGNMVLDGNPEQVRSYRPILVV